ncbi:hypothetical protein E5D57_002268 [Metarhizium anisopliae]|nr:hypothetical protein E5D57_002268 [Metarhizium anisopliae]
MGKRKKSSRKPMGPKKVSPHVHNLLIQSIWLTLWRVHTDLSAAVDVYGEWVDAADAVAKADTAAGNYGSTTARAFNATKRSQSGRAAQGEDEDDAHYEGDGVVADDEEY